MNPVMEKKYAESLVVEMLGVSNSHLKDLVTLDMRSSPQAEGASKN